MTEGNQATEMSGGTTEEEEISKESMQPEMCGRERQGLPPVLPWWQLGEGTASRQILRGVTRKKALSQNFGTLLPPPRNDLLFPMERLSSSLSPGQNPGSLSLSSIK